MTSTTSGNASCQDTLGRCPSVSEVSDQDTLWTEVSWCEWGLSPYFLSLPPSLHLPLLFLPISYPSLPLSFPLPPSLLPPSSSPPSPYFLSLPPSLLSLHVHVHPLPSYILSPSLSSLSLFPIPPSPPSSLPSLPPSLPPSSSRDALVLEVSEKEAKEHFIHKLQEARRNAWFTSLNWYVHGLAKDNRA